MHAFALASAGVTGDDLRDRRRARRIVVAPAVERARSGVHRAARDFRAHEHVGHHVLDRLERTDRPPELLALLGVLGRELDGAGGDAELETTREHEALEAQLLGDLGTPDQLAVR